MGLIALLLVLIIEQYRPLGSLAKIWLTYQTYGLQAKQYFNNDDSMTSAMLAYLLMVLPILLLSGLLLALCMYIDDLLIWPFAAFIFNVLVLYLTMGFRQFSGVITTIRDALIEKRVFDARVALSQWTGRTNEATTPNTIARETIVKGVFDSYHYVFAIIFWFTLTYFFGGWGAMGALLYRLSYELTKAWHQRDNAFYHLSRAVLNALDYVPVRLVALSFALMGNFEEAVYYWRAQLEAGHTKTTGLLLACVEGALGIRLRNKHEITIGNERPILGLGETFEPMYLQDASRLIWRTLLLWLVMIALIYI
jgi:adenosylcobinamide-phosphate synthase